MNLQRPTFKSPEHSPVPEPPVVDLHNAAALETTLIASRDNLVAHVVTAPSSFAGREVRRYIGEVRQAIRLDRDKNAALAIFELAHMTEEPDVFRYKRTPRHTTSAVVTVRKELVGLSKQRVKHTARRVGSLLRPAS